MKPAVLLLEDDPAIADTVRYALEREGFEVRAVALVQAAAASAAAAPPQAAVLDVALPDGNGLELCRRWRASSDARLATLPVLMLTARGEEIDRVIGLEAGADDYLPKPFSPRELVARLRALLRRAAMAAPLPAAPAASRRIGDFVLDEAGQRIHYAGQVLSLTRLEHGLLAELLRAQGRIVSREALFTRVWGDDSEAVDRTVDTHVKTLRAKLRAAGASGELIATHRGMGYSINAGR